jgi:hypothetical protein
MLPASGAVLLTGRHAGAERLTWWGRALWPRGWAVTMGDGMAGRKRTSDDVGRTDEVDERTTSEVVASLVVNAQALLAKEVELLGLEVRGIVSRKLSAVALLLTTAFLATGVLGLGAVTLAIALEDVFDARWHAWGVVTLILLVVSLVVLLVAGKLLAGPWSPVRTRAQLDRTGTWLSELAKDAGTPGVAPTDRADGATEVDR